ARQFCEFVAMRIPNLKLRRQAAKQRARRVLDGERALAVFAFAALLDLAAKKLGEQLHAVADAEHGSAELKDFFVRQGRIFGIHTGRAAGQDDSPGFQRGNFPRPRVEGQDLRIHVALANAARNDLRVLRTKIKDDNLFVHEINKRNALFACPGWFWRAKNVFTWTEFR